MFLVTKGSERRICRTASDLLDYILANSTFSYTVEHIEFYEVKSSPTGDTVTLSDPQQISRLRGGPVPLGRTKETE